jgi:cobalt-zinc-cadmium efflux system outer membrane protein
MMKNSVILCFLLVVSPMLVWASDKTLLEINRIVADKSSYTIQESTTPGGSLDEDQAIRISLSNNLALKALFERFGVDRSEIIEGSLLKNPKLSYSSRKSNESNTKRDNEWEVKVDVMDLLLWPLKLQAKHRQLKFAEFMVASQVLDFIKDVRINFYRLQEAQAVMDSYKDEMTAQQTILDISQGMFKAGNSNILQWQKAQVAFAESKLGYLDAKRDLAIARENLNLLLGLPEGQEDWQVDGQFKDIASSEPKLAELQPLAGDNRLEIVIAKAQVGILSNKLTMARAGLLPEVDVGYDQEREAPGDTLKGPVLETDIPIFNFNQAGMLRYESLLSTAKINVPAIEALVNKEVNVAYQQLMTARLKVVDLKEALPLYQEITRQTLYNYNFMLKDVFSVIEAKRMQLKAQEEFARAMSEYWQARAELEHAVGHSLTN